MAIWYEGNLNKEENRREKEEIVYYIRGLRSIQGKRYERYGVKTHFIERGEDYIEVLRQYVSPLYESGDIISISEKVIAMCQNNTVDKKDVKLGFWAKFLSKFATRTKSGIGMDEPYKLQLAINMVGITKILWAVFCGGIGKLLGKRGLFYKIVGHNVAGIDGFYSHSAIETYHNLAVLSPEKPMKVCEEIYNKLHMSCMIVDANDIAVEVLGYSPDLDTYQESYLADLIQDNPAGQDDELTPFIIIRDIKDREAEEYVPMEGIAVE